MFLIYERAFVREIFGGKDTVVQILLNITNY